MNKIISSFCLAGTLMLSGCSTSETVDLKSDTVNLKSVTAIDTPANVKASINAAANWQQANMDNFESYIPTFLNRTVEPRGWVQGAYYLGLVRWAEATNNAKYRQFLVDHGKEQKWELGDRRYHADDHVIAQYYLYIYETQKNPEIIKPLLHEFDAILANQPTTSLDFEPRGKIRGEGYENDCQKRWCWSDALFMSPPVWFHLTKITGDDKYAAYAHQEFKAVTDYLFDEEYDLYFRDSRFFERRESDGKKIFWSRGNGWVYSGLTHIIDSLAANDSRRAYYIDLFKRMSKSLKALQADNGYWPVSLAAGDLYPVPESSGTAFFVSGFAWGINNNVLDKTEYLPTIKKGWNALLAAQKEDGMIGYVQQVGYAPDQVSPNQTQLYGAGAFLLAGTEMLELVSEK